LQKWGPVSVKSLSIWNCFMMFALMRREILLDGNYSRLGR
jgi:hypothetical protein